MLNPMLQEEENLPTFQKEIGMDLRQGLCSDERLEEVRAQGLKVTVGYGNSLSQA